MSGKTYIASCPRCGKEHYANFGASSVCTPGNLLVASFRTGGKPLVKQLIRSQKTADLALKIASDGAWLEPDYGYCAYACRKCRRVLTRFRLKLAKENSSIWEPEYRCGKCRGKLTPITEQELEHEKIVCSCGANFSGKTLISGEIEEWD